MPDTDGDTVFDRDDVCPEQARGDRPDPDRRGCPLPDTDCDTIVDPDDPCPTTAPGPHPDPERAGCPDGDDDSDTVLNAADQCRAVHQGLHPDPARPGCPIPDSDNDSVIDTEDACPTRPGATSRDPRRHGCPGLVSVETGRIVIHRPVFFATGRDTILSRSQPVLNALLDAVLATPEIRRVSIEGHTDDVGDDAANMDLSERRAQSVMRWLVEHGVEASRLEAHGLGETRPVQVGNTRRIRERNRRVEFRIVIVSGASEAAATEETAR
jgi:outer membrane protein OmpA-like peptidoglycan-associated protein